MSVAKNIHNALLKAFEKQAPNASNPDEFMGLVTTVLKGCFGTKRTKATKVSKEEKEKKDQEKLETPKTTTAYFFFQKEKREVVKAENPEVAITEISKILGGMWKQLSPEKQQHYKDLVIGLNAYRAAEYVAPYAENKKDYDDRFKAIDVKWEKLDEEEKQAWIDMGKQQTLEKKTKTTTTAKTKDGMPVKKKIENMKDEKGRCMYTLGDTEYVCDYKKKIGSKMVKGKVVMLTDDDIRQIRQNGWELQDGVTSSEESGSEESGSEESGSEESGSEESGNEKKKEQKKERKETVEEEEEEEEEEGEEEGDEEEEELTKEIVEELINKKDWNRCVEILLARGVSKDDMQNKAGKYSPIKVKKHMREIEF